MMAKYKVSYSGFVYVEADTAEEAEEKAFDEVKSIPKNKLIL